MPDLSKLYDDMGSGPTSSTASEPPSRPSAERRRAFYDDATPASTVDPDTERNATARRRAETFEAQRNAGRRSFYSDMRGPEAASPLEKPAEKPPAKPGQAVKAETAAAPLKLAPPEGFDASSDAWKEFTRTASELRLDAKGAERLLQMHQAEVARTRDANLDAWEAAARLDREIGGDRLERTIADARDFIDRHGTPELTALLDETGLGSHPEVLRALARAARASRGR
jgi:hypothetical protein